MQALFLHTLMFVKNCCVVATKGHVFFGVCDLWLHTLFIFRRSIYETE